MVKQYPHSMILASVGVTTARDSNGNWLPEAPVESEDEISCRYETKDGNGYVTSESGVQEAYDAIVYIPLPVNPITLGTTVTISENGQQIAKGTVKHFHKGQLNARIWI